MTTRKGALSDLGVPSFVLLVTLGLKIFLVLDFTDEQQYYGELIGLLQSDRLFSNDLFVQQIVWLLYYPLIKPYYMVIGDYGLIVYARLLLALTLLVFYFWGVRKLVLLGVSRSISAWCLIAATFSVTYGNTFAISYNVIGLLALSVFSLKFLDWERSFKRTYRSAAAWATLPFLAAFAHPTIAILIAVLTLIRAFMTASKGGLKNLLICYIVALIVGLAIAFAFASFEDYMNALGFSKGFGVGSVFFSSQSEINRYLLSVGVIGLGLLLRLPVDSRWPIFAALGYGLFICYQFVSGEIGYGVSYDTLLALSILTALLFASLNRSKIWRDKARLIALVLFVMGTVFAVTSGNGVRAMLGPLFVAIPLLSAFVTQHAMFVFSGTNRYKALSLVFPITIVALFFSYWSYYPYRSEPWFRSLHSSEMTVPALAGLRMGKNKAHFLNDIDKHLNSLAGESVLLTGYVPVVYFALELRAETCMFFMHTLTSDVSRDTLMDCLKKKNPTEVILMEDERTSAPNLAVNDLIRELYMLKGCQKVVVERPTFEGRGTTQRQTTLIRCRVTS